MYDNGINSTKSVSSAMRLVRDCRGLCASLCSCPAGRGHGVRQLGRKAKLNARRVFESACPNSCLAHSKVSEPLAHLARRSCSVNWNLLFVSFPIGVRTNEVHEKEFSLYSAEIWRYGEAN